jgi:hypothetical protein
MRQPVQPAPYTPEWLNSLADEEKKAIVGGEFGRRMHDSGGSRVTWLYWRGAPRILRAPPIERNGSAIILDCGRGLFAVTAGHVLEQWLADRNKTQRIGCQIGNVPFDLADRLIDTGTNRGIDIATFRITPDEVAQLGKQVVIGSGGAWPPPPKPGEVVYLGGFLGSQRRTVGPNEISFGLHSAMTPVTDFTEHQIRCRFNRRYWVDPRGLGLPLPGYNLGGLSGGPLLSPIYIDGEWSWRLAGVISEANMSREYEVVTAVHADFIRPDGQIVR